MVVHLIDPQARSVRSEQIRNAEYVNNAEITTLLGAKAWAVTHRLTSGDVLGVSFPNWFKRNMATFALKPNCIVCGPAFVFRRVETGLISEPNIGLPDLQTLVDFEFPGTYSSLPGVAHRWPFRGHGRSPYFDYWDAEERLPGFIKRTRFFIPAGL